MKHIGGGTYEQTFDPDGRPGRLLGLRGPRLHPQAPRRRRRLLPRRDDDDADDLRRDAPGLLRPARPASRTWDEPRRGVAVLPDVPAVLRPDLHRGQGPGARRGLRLRLQRLDGRGVVRRLRRRADPADHRARCGTPSSRPPRCAATPRAACHAVCFSRDPRPPRACPASTPASGIRSSQACEETETVVCMHIGVVVADAGHVARRAGRGRGHAELRQRHGRR